ncbi:MAG: hypothetical protein JW822_12645 [Spirochaetales bacterium]|nr:hypothetical protein [Spirochaetales bacterium]
MQEEKLDELIKAHFKKTCVKIDISQGIMKEIERYEYKKLLIKNSFRFIVIFFTVAASISSIVLIELLFKYHSYYLTLYNINIIIIKISLEGFFVLAVVSIITLAFKFKRLGLFRIQFR